MEIGFNRAAALKNRSPPIEDDQIILNIDFNQPFVPEDRSEQKTESGMAFDCDLNRSIWHPRNFQLRRFESCNNQKNMTPPNNHLKLFQKKIASLIGAQRKSVAELERIRKNGELIQPAVIIDFDKASKEWRTGKMRVGQNMFYLCGQITKRGTPCKRFRDKCWYHPK